MNPIILYAILWLVLMLAFNIERMHSAPPPTSLAAYEVVLGTEIIIGIASGVLFSRWWWGRKKP